MALLTARLQDSSPLLLVLLLRRALHYKDHSLNNANVEGVHGDIYGLASTDCPFRPSTLPPILKRFPPHKQDLNLDIDREQEGPTPSSAHISQLRWCSCALHLSEVQSGKRRGDLSILPLLVAGISVNRRDGVGDSALHIAARDKCQEISVRRLLCGGASIAE